MGDTTSVTHSDCETPDISFVLDTNHAPRASIPIDILNDDVLLVIFDYCRLADEDEDDSEDVEDAFNEGNWNWDRQRWWHKLTQVCQRWRSLILASPSRLNLHVVCTEGVPVAEMLAHFLPLPLIVIYGFEEDEEIPPEDEQNILLSLELRHHVRRILLSAATPALQKMITPLDDEFPLLDSLAITSVSDCDPTGVILPRSLRAPNLRHLILMNVAIQTGTPILTTPIHLVTLVLEGIPTSAHIPPDYLVDLLEFVPQLKILSVGFHPPILDHENVGTRPLTPEAQDTFITLRRLKQLQFRGVSTYLESLLARINAPVLELFYVRFFNQRSFDTLPNLSRFLETTTELRFRVAEMNFHIHSVTVDMVNVRPHRNTSLFRLRAKGHQLDWQIKSASQLCRAIVPVFSVTEELTFGYRTHEKSSDTRSSYSRLRWHNILRQFSSVKTLKVADGLVEELSSHLQPDGDEPLLELVPKLQQIEIPTWVDAENPFAAFIDARRIAGHPVNLVRTDGW